MKKLALFLLFAIPLTTAGQDKKAPTTLRGVLLEQLRTTHGDEDWFELFNPGSHPVACR